MTRTPFGTLTARTVVLPIDDVDTDQIIPARFLKGTTRDALGRHLFAGWRDDPVFALNRPEAAGAEVLVAGRNFGCGSSREHAVWALRDWGFRAVVAPSFADIFRANALKNGLLPVAVGADAHAKLLAAPGAAVVVDLETRTLVLPDGTREAFPVEPFARRCLLEGMDELDFLLSATSSMEV
jgi:3-isopropylmalate/(R)-2-methylmalate dehydratase small subunit